MPRAEITVDSAVGLVLPPARLMHRIRLLEDLQLFHRSPFPSPRPCISSYTESWLGIASRHTLQPAFPFSALHRVQAPPQCEYRTTIAPINAIRSRLCFNTLRKSPPRHLAGVRSRDSPPTESFKISNCPEVSVRRNRRM